LVSEVTINKSHATVTTWLLFTDTSIQGLRITDKDLAKWVFAPEERIVAINGVDLISDALPFGRLWYGNPDAVSQCNRLRLG
jgi:hypothetical protein